MKLPKSIITIFIIVVAIISFSLLSPLILDSTSTSNTSGFMDLEVSIKELQQIVDKTRPGVVMVIVYDDSGAESGRGSGFFIDKEGRIIMNESIMNGAYSAEIFSKSNHYDDVVILNRDRDIDLALIQVKTNDEIPLELDFDYKIMSNYYADIAVSRQQRRSFIKYGWKGNRGDEYSNS
jgi:S1-C subfamily serine protease